MRSSLPTRASWKSRHGAFDRQNGAATIACSVSDCGIGIAPDQLGKLFDDFARPIHRSTGGSAAPGWGLRSASASSSRWAATSGSSRRSASALRSALRSPCRLPSVAELGGGDSAANNDDFAARADHASSSHCGFCWPRIMPPISWCSAKLMQGFNADMTIAVNGREARGAGVAPHVRYRVHGHADARDGRAGGDARDSRAWRDWARIPIVALTANAFADDVKACRDAGMNEFIVEADAQEGPGQETGRAVGRIIRCWCRPRSCGARPAFLARHEPAGDATGRGGDGRCRTDA